MGVVSAGLGCGPNEDLVDRQPTWPGYSEGNDLGDVLGGDGQCSYKRWAPCLASTCVMCSVSSVATAPGSMMVTRTSGCSSWRSASDQPLIPHFVAAYAALPARAVRPATEEIG